MLFGVMLLCLLGQVELKFAPRACGERCRCRCRYRSLLNPGTPPHPLPKCISLDLQSRRDRKEVDEKPKRNAKESPSRPAVLDAQRFLSVKENVTQREA